MVKMVIMLACAVLLALAMVVRAQDEPAGTRAPGPVPEPAGTRAPGPVPEPAGRLLDEMLRPAEALRPLQPQAGSGDVDQASGEGALPPAAPAVRLMREGTVIVDRVGRLSRGSDGQMEFIFESDGRALRDPPVGLLPNLKLMAMENAVTSSSRDLRFRITGEVTEYRGRNHVLLHKVVVVPEAGM